MAPPAEQLDPAELERISVEAVPGVADGVERIRGLEFRRLPEPEVVSSAYLNRLGARELERQEGELGLAADDAVGRITGLLAPGEDLRAAYESTGDLAAAAYDPRTKRLFVVSDAVAANRALVEFVLAHELDHALEDQRFGLRDARRLDDDGALAAQALTEGSATAVMTDFAVRHLNPLELLAATDTIDQGAGDVPAVLVEQLTWTYLGGQRFVTELRELAGGWKLVDYALSERPPASTEQVLHPRKYLADERPEPVRIDPGGARGAGLAAGRPQRVRRARDRLPAAGGRRRRGSERGRGGLERRPLRALATGDAAGGLRAPVPRRTWRWSRAGAGTPRPTARSSTARRPGTSPPASTGSRWPRAPGASRTARWRWPRAGTAPHWSSPRTRSPLARWPRCAAQPRKLKRSRRWVAPATLLAAFWIFAGTMHFIRAREYEATVPDYVPISPEDAVSWSGYRRDRRRRRWSSPPPPAGSGAGGCSASWWRSSRPTCTWRWTPRTSRLAASPSTGIPRWLLWARLPIQPLFMLWAWRATE